jgi:hypothetical protein
MKSFTSQQMLHTLYTATPSVKPVAQGEDPHFGPRVVPHELRGWLARLRLLQGVPFAYLVPDVDRGWTDALVQGALSVGTVNASDRAELAALYARVRDEVDEEERRVRMPGGEAVQQGPGGTVSGFVMRSRAVSGWPGLHVRAYDRELGVADDAVIPESDPRRLKLLRMERLAPAVMLVLFDGVPAVVHVEEPRQGIQFGVRLESVGGNPNNLRAFVVARNGHTAEDVLRNGRKVDVDVPFRPGSPGVVDIARLNQALMGTAGTNMGTGVDSAEYAVQMLRFPYRQVFGDPSVQAPALDTVFRPTLDVAAMVKRFTVTR